MILIIALLSYHCTLNHEFRAAWFKQAQASGHQSYSRAETPETPRWRRGESSELPMIMMMIMIMIKIIVLMMDP